MPVKARANIGSYCPKNKRTPVIGHAANNGHSSVIYKFSQNNFLSTAADAVHAVYPFHLVGGFERFGHTFLLCHSRNDDFHSFIAGLVNLGKVPMQRPRCEKVRVENRPMSFQITAAHTSILADLIFWLIWQGKVWDKVIALLMISAAHLLK